MDVHSPKNGINKLIGIDPYPNGDKTMEIQWNRHEKWRGLTWFNRKNPGKCGSRTGNFFGVYPLFSHDRNGDKYGISWDPAQNTSLGMGDLSQKKLQNDVFHMPPEPLFMSSFWDG